MSQPKPRYLTKSRFKIGCQCPTKLYYSAHVDEYGSTKIDNPFLQALARGGFQVGALAQQYFPDGVLVDTLDYEKSLAQTNELLKQENVTIFEAALKSGELFVRVDILIKRGHEIDLIEVKSKSYNKEKTKTFYDQRALKSGKKVVVSKWRQYLLDVAFQTYVARQVFGEKFKINPYLYLADVTKTASVDGLNQRFVLTEDNRVLVDTNLRREDLGEEILIKKSVADEVDHLLTAGFQEGLGFADSVKLLTKYASGAKRAPVELSSECGKCEFRIDDTTRSGGLKSGFEECWATRLKSDELTKDLVIDLWDNKRVEAMMNEGKLTLDSLEESDLATKSKSKEEKDGLPRHVRQWKQVEFAKFPDRGPYIDLEGLAEAFATWKFPLHMIDFETATVAIPFHRGRRPYEQIAFQFSHHIIQADGRVEHQKQYLHAERGQFPNFAFARALRNALGESGGTIFRYSPHENTILSAIHDQLRVSKESDRDELCAWIRSVTKSPEEHEEEWEGPRAMVDLWDAVKRYYIHPKMKGSNSIKQVLPAVLSDSEYLHKKYGSKVYGDGLVTTLNYPSDWIWLERDARGEIVDPYKKLPQVFGLTSDELDRFIPEGFIGDGGAALTAYARLQFTDMSDEARRQVQAALLRYCELDTLAMVMLFEAWREELRRAGLFKRAA